MKIKQIYIVALLLITKPLFAQQLQPGFSKTEYKELLLISTRTTSNDEYANTFPEPKGYKRVYQSVVMGLDNHWELWMNTNNSVAVISIRGTTKKAESWLANFYAAMVPAKGELKLTDQNIFKYKLAPNPKAAIHVGWLLSMAYLSEDILLKIDSIYNTGTKNILLMGHSQGGAITFLLTAYLNNLQKEKVIPEDIQFKTYCSAAPKPGNLYFAYHYETFTQNGWAFNVVNSADWVPETPISIQTLNDFNTLNPFVNAKEKIKEQKFPKNIVLKSIYNKLDKPTKRAQKNYEKYLGDKTSIIIRKELKDFTPPTYYKSNHYVRTGTTIVLFADEAYYKLFPDDRSNVFMHHLHKPYLYLLDKTKF